MSKNIIAQKRSHRFRHGMTKTRTYRSWSEMRQRCFNPNQHVYHLYGGRGISICDRWSSFEMFYLDMGERPDGLTLDRLDTNGNYTPDNCRWATPKEQSRNRPSYNRMIEYNGEKKCMGEWSEIYGLKRGTLWRRLNVGDIPPECFRPVIRGR